MFIGYPKGTSGGFIYSFSYKKVIVITHATFLEEDYVNNFKSKSKVILKELDSTKEPPEFGSVVPLFSVHVQKGKNENIPECEQAQMEPIVKQQTDIQVEPENQIQNNEEDLLVEP